MAIRVRCPFCEAGFNVQDYLEGKKIRCPKCEEIIPVRRLDAEDETRILPPNRLREAEVLSPRDRAEEPRPRKRWELDRYDQDDDDGPRRDRDLDEDQPRKRKKKKQHSQEFPLILLLAGGGGVLLLLVIGLVLLLTLGKSDSSKAPGKDNFAQNPNNNPLNKGNNPKPNLNPRADPLAFNEQLVASLRRLSSAENQLGVALGLAQGGGNTQAVHNQRQTALNVLKEIRGEMQTWAVPASNSGKNLYQGYQRYLQSHEENINLVGQILSVLENPGLSPQQKNHQYTQLLRQLDSAERSQLAELDRLQREFAREHKIILR